MKSHRIFKGSALKQMPKLFDAGLRPLTIEEIFLGRMDGTLSNNKWYTSSVLSCTNPNGDMRFALCDEYLLRKLVHPQAKVKHGAIQVSPEIYDRFSQDYEIKAKDVELFGNKPNTKNEAKESPFWRLFLSDTVRDKIINSTFERLEKDYNRTKGMGIWTSSLRSSHTVRLWFVDNVYYNSLADGYYNVDDTIGRVVGVVPEAPYDLTSPATYRDAPKEVASPKKKTLVETLRDSARNVWRGGSK